MMFNAKKNKEEAYSTIPWKKVEPEMKEQLVLALCNKSKKIRVWINLFMILINIFILYVIGYCLFQASKDMTDIYLYCIDIIPACIILVAFDHEYVKGYQYMHPER